MTTEPSDRTAALRERTAISHRRAAAACQRAAAVCGDAARFAEDVSVVSDSFAAEATSVGLARRTVAERAAKAGVTGAQLEAIRLAVSEAVSNVVIHAYPDGPGDFRVRTLVDCERLTVRVSDDGCGPDAPSAHRGLGCGLELIAASADISTVRRRRRGGTEVVMRWTITSAE